MVNIRFIYCDTICLPLSLSLSHTRRGNAFPLLSGERTKVRGLFHLYFFTFVPLILTFSLREKEFSSISSPLRGEDFRHRRICLWQKGEGDYVR
jgi:hypothetical protein